MGLDKIFSFIEKLFWPSSGYMGFIFCLNFARNKSLGMLLTYGDCKKCFLSQRNCFPKFIAISQFQSFLGSLRLL